MAQRFKLFSVAHLQHLRAKRMISGLDEIKVAKMNGDPLPIYDSNFGDHDYAESQPHHALYSRDALFGFNVESRTWKSNGILWVNLLVDKMDIIKNRRAGPGTIINQFFEEVPAEIVVAEQNNHPLFNRYHSLPQSAQASIEKSHIINEKEIETIKHEIEQEINRSY